MKDIEPYLFVRKLHPVYDQYRIWLLKIFLLVVIPLFVVEIAMLYFMHLSTVALMEIPMLLCLLVFFNSLWKKIHYFANLFVLFSFILCSYASIMFICSTSLLIFYIVIPIFYYYFLDLKRASIVTGSILLILVASAVHYTRVNGALPWPTDELFIACLAFIYVCVLTIAYSQTNNLLVATLKQKAELDGLTNIYSRRTFFDIFHHDLESSKDNSSHLSLLILDIDHFKNINDTHGHQTGDVTLKTIADICLNELRKKDIIGRIGGEEFACLLPETDQSAAVSIAEKLRTSIAGANWQEIPQCTASIGIATLKPDDTVNDLYKRADTALYHAKNSGRNRVAVL